MQQPEDRAPDEAGQSEPAPFPVMPVVLGVIGVLLAVALLFLA